MWPDESEAFYTGPEGASRFQFPGLARSLTAYCVDGLVFYSPTIAIIVRASLKLVTCAGSALCPRMRLQAWFKKYGVLS
jgi:hypothetical protein